MLSVGRAIVEPRRLLVVDEPTKGLAPAVIEHLIGGFRQLKAARTTVLLVEQNFGMARALGDGVAVMDDGRVVHHRRRTGDGEITTAILGRDGPVDLTPPGFAVTVESLLES